MTDVFTKKKRSLIMSQITGKHTSPELRVRKALYSIGIRYRLHDKKLSGHPDIVIRRLKIALFVNGCFWHQHKNCKRSTIPKTNRKYWLPKLKRNIEKQVEDFRKLRKAGWKIAVVWECQTKNQNKLELRLRRIFV